MRTFVAIVTLIALFVSDDTGRSKSVRQVLESEALIESLRTPLATVSRSLQNLTLPGGGGRAVFSESVDVVDLSSPPSDWRTIGDLVAREGVWRVGDSVSTRSRDELVLWNAFLERVDYFDYGSFYTISGRFDPENSNLFRSPSGFKGRARMKDGTIAWILAKVDLDWKRVSGEWRIATFRTREFTTTTATHDLFEDVASTALVGPGYRRAVRSLRDEFLVDWVTGIRRGEVDLDVFIPNLMKSVLDGSYKDDWSHVCVVDIDRDGYDDIYLMPFNQPPLMFRNNGDGSFEEIGSRLRLDIDGAVAATFADFDNDGDDDAVISIYPDETRMYQNQEGRFVAGQSDLPGCVLAMATADYDRDGLLDLYLIRYNGSHHGPMTDDMEKKLSRGEKVVPAYPGLSGEEARKLAEISFQEGEPFVNVPGPPNVLLHNVGGGRFVRAENAAAVEPYRQTLSAAWSDIDLDGDQDLYIVNEGGPNQLVRNDGSEGFVDITTEATLDVGFGMGASFGDFDENGRPDLYVTNMYSKAGRRIAEQMKSDKRVVSSARGNSLLRNTENGFEFVPSVVEAADFGWGGAFVDVNNDGTLDLYAPAGYVSMPKEVSIPGDT